MLFEIKAFREDNGIVDLTVEAANKEEALAAILAQGLLRLRTQGDTPLNVSTENEFGLGFSPEQSVHVHPADQALEDTP